MIEASANKALVRVTLRQASEQAAQVEDERERVGRVDRLRAPYADYTTSANSSVGQASLLPIALAQSSPGQPQFFEQLHLSDHINTTHKDAMLALEGESDRAVVHGVRGAEHRLLVVPA